MDGINIGNVVVYFQENIAEKNDSLIDYLRDCGSEGEGMADHSSNNTPETG